MKFARITVDPQQMGGVPCLRRPRIPAATYPQGCEERRLLEALRLAMPR